MELSPATLQKHWRKYFAEGFLLLVLGTLALVLPVLTEAGLAVILGTVILWSGLIGFVTTVHAPGAPGTVSSLGSATLGVLVGSVLLLHPKWGIQSFTLILIAFLAIEGTLSIRFSLEHQRQLNQRWHWMLMSGALDLALAVALLINPKNIAEWAPNGAIALDFIAGGCALLGMALAGRECSHRRALFPPDTIDPARRRRRRQHEQSDRTPRCRNTRHAGH